MQYGVMGGSSQVFVTLIRYLNRNYVTHKHLRAMAHHSIALDNCCANHSIAPTALHE